MGGAAERMILFGALFFFSFFPWLGSRGENHWLAQFAGCASGLVGLVGVVWSGIVGCPERKGEARRGEGSVWSEIMAWVVFSLLNSLEFIIGRFMHFWVGAVSNCFLLFLASCVMSVMYVCVCILQLFLFSSCRDGTSFVIILTGHAAGDFLRMAVQDRTSTASFVFWFLFMKDTVNVIFFYLVLPFLSLFPYFLGIGNFLDRRGFQLSNI